MVPPKGVNPVVSKNHPHYATFVANLRELDGGKSDHILGDSPFIHNLLTLAQAIEGDLFNPSIFARLFEYKNIWPLDRTGHMIDGLAIARGVAQFFPHPQKEVLVGKTRYAFNSVARFLRYFGVDHFSKYHASFQVSDWILLCGKWGTLERAATVGGLTQRLGLQGLGLVLGPKPTPSLGLSWEDEVFSLPSPSQRLDGLLQKQIEGAPIDLPFWCVG